MLTKFCLSCIFNTMAAYDLAVQGTKTVNSLRPRQNRRHFADDVFKCNFLNENAWIQIKISLKFVRKGPINNIPALVQIMAWCWTGDKPLSEPVMTHIRVSVPKGIQFRDHFVYVPSQWETLAGRTHKMIPAIVLVQIFRNMIWNLLVSSKEKPAFWFYCRIFFQKLCEVSFMKNMDIYFISWEYVYSWHMVWRVKSWNVI